MSAHATWMYNTILYARLQTYKEEWPASDNRRRINFLSPKFHVKLYLQTAIVQENYSDPKELKCWHQTTFVHKKMDSGCL